MHKSSGLNPVLVEYCILFLIVVGIHLTPAFTPPTWPIIVLFSLGTPMPLPQLVIIATIAAALGRYALACGARLFVHRLSERSWRNLEIARGALERRKTSRFLLFFLFALTPLPSAQLFEAAGVLGLRLSVLTAAFSLGRLGFYSLYALGAHGVQQAGIGDALQENLLSPFAIIVQLVLLVLLALLIRVDWSRWLRRSED